MGTNVDVPEFLTPELNKRLDRGTFIPNMSAGGYNYTVSGPPGARVSKLSRSHDRGVELLNVHRTLDNALKDTINVRSQYTPGYSNMRKAGLRQIRESFMPRRSNLRDDMSRRNLFGSSFSQSAQNRLAKEEANTRADFTAKTYLQELAVTERLMKYEHGIRHRMRQMWIDEWDKEAKLGSQLYQHSNEIMTRIARMFTDIAIAQGNAETQANIAEAQANASIASAGIGAIGSLL